MTAAEEIGSSRVRLAIAELLSVRPRTLGELADETGISVQAVLKHLKKIAATGRLTETRLSGNRFLGVRKVYSLHKGKVGSYSRDDLMIAHYSSSSNEMGSPVFREGSKNLAGLDLIAEEIMIQRRRIGSMAKRMERLIVELESNEERLEEAIHMRGLNSELELVAMTLFTEPGAKEAGEVLSKYYACAHPEEAISAALEGLGSSA